MNTYFFPYLPMYFQMSLSVSWAAEHGHLMTSFLYKHSVPYYYVTVHLAMLLSITENQTDLPLKCLEGIHLNQIKVLYMIFYLFSQMTEK